MEDKQPCKLCGRMVFPIVLETNNGLCYNCRKKKKCDNCQALIDEKYTQQKYVLIHIKFRKKEKMGGLNLWKKTYETIGTVNVTICDKCIEAKEFDFKKGDKRTARYLAIISLTAFIVYWLVFKMQKFGVLMASILAAIGAILMYSWSDRATAEGSLFEVLKDKVLYDHYPDCFVGERESCFLKNDYEIHEDRVPPSII